MSERQAKRLRRAQRAYIRRHKHELNNTRPAHQQAAVRVGIVRKLWPRLNHAGRGVVGGLLAGDNLKNVPAAALMRGQTVHYARSNLDGALCALGIPVPQ